MPIAAPPRWGPCLAALGTPIAVSLKRHGLWSAGGFRRRLDVVPPVRTNPHRLTSVRRADLSARRPAIFLAAGRQRDARLASQCPVFAGAHFADFSFGDQTLNRARLWLWPPIRPSTFRFQHFCTHSVTTNEKRRVEFILARRAMPSQISPSSAARVTSDISFAGPYFLLCDNPVFYLHQSIS